MNLFGIAVLVTILLGLFKVGGLLAVSWFVVFIPLMTFGVLAAVVLVFVIFGVIAAAIAHRISR